MALQTPEHLLCDCGSGEPFERQHDGRGIYLCRTCPACEKQKLSGFRSDIFESYDADETIDGEPGVMGDHEEQYGGAFDGFNVTSDADPGL